MRFSDVNEQASALEEMEREHALAAVRRNTGNSLKPVGRCYFCDEVDIRPQAIFCDNDCRDMWQREKDAKVRNGR